MRTVFVTGGGRGIGRAIAQSFSSRGYRVAVAARSRVEIDAVAQTLVQAGGTAAAVVCDVTDEASVRGAVAEAEAQLGPVDVLVNNAGYAESAPLVRTDHVLWARTIAVNLTGTYFCTAAVLPGMLARQWGRIINVASTAGRKGYAYTAADRAAKHGVVGLTRALALEVAARGVTVNAVCPGWVETEMTEASIERIVHRTGRSEAEARASLEAMNPQRRLMTPEEIAAATLFLAGDEARGITGQTLLVDGGELVA